MPVCPCAFQERFILPSHELAINSFLAYDDSTQQLDNSRKPSQTYLFEVDLRVYGKVDTARNEQEKSNHKKHQ